MNRSGEFSYPNIETPANRTYWVVQDKLLAGAYVHCFGGMGRTGTTVCCRLLRHGYVTRANALSSLTRLRQADKDRASWKAPENVNQESFVLNWAD